MAVRVLRWPLFCLLAVWAVIPGDATELKDELDSLLCPSMEAKRGKIIDVHKSLDLGAKLLDGSWAPTLDECVSECCHRKGCDLALYKNDGLSQSGKNCYYIDCVSEENCVMVDHSGFTSVVFKVDRSSVPDNHDGEERTGHDPPTANSSPNTQAPPTTVASDDKGKSSTNGDLDTPSSSSSLTAEATTPSSDGGRVNSSSEAPPPTTAAGSTEKAEEADGVDDKSLLNPEGKGQGGVGLDECGRHGCDGSGLIAIAVVGSVCFVIIVLVVAVLLKKVISDNRRRKFNNVDYLINGMYT